MRLSGVLCILIYLWQYAERLWPRTCGLGLGIGFGLDYITAGKLTFLRPSGLSLSPSDSCILSPLKRWYACVLLKAHSDGVQYSATQYVVVATAAG